ncbi:hypothetical protein S7711_05007 [Stachybotrys chartarum IBT 7711]|uniref:tetrahydrofolate synthase n=1 Tax=Stachybotrys chartarum (strain CBS 109288 / IBT 7711) TaxID=1280523 RepID=A0A084ARE0_STACB|nr:hypothetical protein S7711_05007 [Stachybotrys chartarum IBT 7711]
MSSTVEHSSDMPPTRDFKAAIAILRSRARLRRPTQLGTSTLPSAAFPNGEPQFTGKPPIQGMEGWLQLLGHPHEKLSVVHIAGTKGKGSTAAMVESFLRSKGLRTGLYTSPHLVTQTERFRINFKPLAEEAFAKYFFEVYDGLGLSDEVISPRYLQLQALVAFYVFAREKVDIAICETHHGGEFDATNIIRNTIAAGITPIGMDHVFQLGPSIENIAWHKAGIIKPGASAFSAVQSPEVARVLAERGAEKGVTVNFVPRRQDLDETGLPDLQQQNCSLAIAISDSVLEKRSMEPLSQGQIVDAMRQFRWPGRFQTVRGADGTWFLDGAHNELSIERSAEWFSEASAAESGDEPPRILIYSHLSDSRDGEGMLRSLIGALRVPLQHVVLTTYDLRGLEAERAEDMLRRYDKVCRNHLPDATVWIKPDIEDALQCARNVCKDTTAGKAPPHIFITGSLYLVGRVLKVLDVKI